jgi:hypothetical protein
MEVSRDLKRACHLHCQQNVTITHTDFSRTGMLDEDKMEAKSRIVKRLKGTWTHEAGRGKGGKGETDIQFGDRPLAASPAPDPVMQDEFAAPEPGQKVKKGKLTKRLLDQGLVTPDMMKQLKREIAKEDSKS